MIVLVNDAGGEFALPAGFMVARPWSHDQTGALERQTEAGEYSVSGDGLALPMVVDVKGRATFTSVGDMLSWLADLQNELVTAARLEHRASGYTRRWELWPGIYGLRTETDSGSGRAADVTMTLYPKGEGVVV